MKKIAYENGGFSIAELVVAIGILGVIGAIVGFMMLSSSRNYNKMSIEAQLQSEAELVANAISEVIIDAYDGADKVDASFKSKYGGTYNVSDNCILYLKSMEAKNVDDTRYVICKSNTENEIYIGESKYSGTWSDFDYYLLGKNVSNFTVDTSNLANNVVNFTLTYTKDKKSYNGNYQVLMRNRAYADKETKDVPKPGSNKMVLDLKPKHIYIEVKGDTTGIDAPTGKYYNNEISGTGLTSLDKKFPLTGTATSNASIDRGVEWEIKGNDPAVFTLEKTPIVNYDENGNETPGANPNLAEQAYIAYVPGANVNNSSIDDFTVQISRSAMVGTEEISAPPKTAKIHLQRVKSITVSPTSGLSPWNPSWTKDTVKKIDGVDGYVTLNGDGSYSNVVVRASILHKYVPNNGGGVLWELQYKLASEGATAWKTPDRNIASITTAKTDSTYVNTIKFGSDVKNDMMFRIVAFSAFDPTKKDDYTFGLSPRRVVVGKGYNSRGIRTPLNAYFGSDEFKNGGFVHDGNAAIYADVYAGNITDIVAANSVSDFDASAFRIIKPTEKDPNFYMYVDYDAYFLSADQLKNFFKKASFVELTVTTPSGTCKVRYYLFPVFVHNDSTLYTKNSSYEYPSNFSPTDQPRNMIVVTRGGNRTITVKFEYYNLIKESLIGFYVDDDSVYSNTKKFGGNMLRSSNGGNTYLDITKGSSLDDVTTFVDTLDINISGRKTTVYNPNPMTFRVAAENYYIALSDDKNQNGSASQIVNNNRVLPKVSTFADAKKADQDWSNGKELNCYTSSCVDYEVFVANVEGQDVFISCPDTKIGFPAIIFPGSISSDKNKPTGVTGVNANGECFINFAGVYKDGSQTKLVYNGITYTYNVTYKYWKRD